MATVLGSGSYRYEPQENWAKLPEGWALGEVAAVAVDDRDRVYVFNRSERPMMVFDRDGNFLSTWGADLFKWPHGLHIGPDQSIYCTDEGSHTVCKCSLDGKLQLRIGTPGQSAPRMSGKPFNRCTHTALSPSGEIYVTDGYGNASVHKYAPDGTWLLSWGMPGTDRGQFNLPHNIVCDADGWVYVADRENHRIQIFDGNGRYEGQWNNLHRPSALFMTPGPCPICFVGEIGPYLAVNRDTPNLGPRISILDKGEVVGRLDSQGGPGTGAAQFTSPHGLALDSRGDLYVGEVTASAWPSLFPGQPKPAVLNSLKKFRRIPDSA
ncbi:peptidyl-alpha-hydroxyglycine alpha-amidating lyase family protein [Bosea sp. (in: a-proteobacteria)]|uniref:peptidyl-alpha-hydroxyglycine alpha-amidating lyase family protein n=1 Tax=Bosea sp. (in: a-proteobacteria) TaxID=1871050 RepID=UPI0026273464|nr:peptidyl-alpha-hydroxyglycine alpha-amidating lyase family protein [Bosea sp. (in: a-proteobacteria)]MCO5091686.1 peptidyl-alpha-hydroxyglycine alpha-amidating lyase family protein [Bosea sp. (in: a-proteobacteria)]